MSAPLIGPVAALAEEQRTLGESKMKRAAALLEISYMLGRLDMSADAKGLVQTAIQYYMDKRS